MKPQDWKDFVLPKDAAHFMKELNWIFDAKHLSFDEKVVEIEACRNGKTLTESLFPAINLPSI